MTFQKFIRDMERTGFARGCRYLVEFEDADSDFDGISLRCSGAQIPGVILKDSDVTINVVAEQNVHGIEYPPIPLQVILSKDMREKIAIENWIGQAYNQKTRTFRFKDTYTKDIILSQLDESDNKMYSMKLKQAFASNIGDLVMDATSGTYHTMTVLIKYKEWETLPTIQTGILTFTP